MEGTLSVGTQGEDGYVPQNVTVDTAAETFVRDGLSKVMKITNICTIPLGANDDEATKSLSDCGLPDKIIPINGGTVVNLSKFVSIGKYRPVFAGVRAESSRDENLWVELLNTKAAAFETVNGESILVHYNPNCVSNMDETEYHLVQPKLCANFIYDLNGKKGPNTMGKDIGFITALYATDPVVVSPNIYPKDTSSMPTTFTNAIEKCKELDGNGKLPTIEELISILYNRPIVILNIGSYVSGTSNNENFWALGEDGAAVQVSKKYSFGGSAARCVKR